MAGDSGNPGHSCSQSDLERDDTFHARLRKILDGERSSSSFAKRAGISQSGFHRIEKGGDPTLKTIIAIANAAGVSVQWLATGEGDRQGVRDRAPGAAPASGEPPLDKWLFSRVIDGIRRVHKDAGAQVPTVMEVEAALDMHHRIAAIAQGREAQHGALLMALDQMERELREKSVRPASGKQSA